MKKEMVLKHKKPCSQCPFLKDSKKGYFGPFTPEMYLRQAHSEGGVFCHTANHGEKFSVVCVGSLQHANASCKIYANPKLYDYQKQVGKNVKVLDYSEFKMHHMAIDPKPIKVTDEDTVSADKV